MKTAVVIGASGLIGKTLVRKLFEDNRYNSIKVFVRRSINILNSKLVEHIVDFDKITDWKNKITGDELYSAMGTTIKKAGSKEAQYKIDVTYQYEFAKAAAENGVSSYFLVSSSGANAKSKLFYVKIKGELEEKVKLLPLNKIRIFRPSLLLGERDEKRFGEKAAERLLKIIVPLFPFLKNQRPIEGEKVARAMIVSANEDDKERIKIFEPLEIFQLAEKI
ncbi:MAG TPA: NAD-dependent epimerase/dehydratase family protein [Ignavibacteriaceae bacterium]|nr:NAD-dependent epimerase/dehydratase family protein [Ignavibacteriaceae bacterium]